MKRRLFIILILIFSFLLTACNNGNKDTLSGKSVQVYYVDSKTMGLANERYTLIGTKTEDQMNELKYMLNKTPENAVYKSALPQDSQVEFSLDDTGGVVVNFDASYSNLDEVSKVLCLAAIVKTMCQISGVEYVQFNEDDQPLQDSDGVVSRRLTAEDFIDNTEPSTSYKAKLYFANKAGDALVEYTTEIKYNGTQSIEELVLNQLINGPTEIGMYSTIPEGTILLNVSKSDGICTVDFNEKFLEKLANINENIAIYSVVNTLVELPDINKVQFTINGKVQKTYWEDVSLEGTFEGEIKYIENPS